MVLIFLSLFPSVERLSDVQCPHKSHKCQLTTSVYIKQRLYKEKNVSIQETHPNVPIFALNIRGSRNVQVGLFPGSTGASQERGLPVLDVALGSGCASLPVLEPPLQSVAASDPSCRSTGARLLHAQQHSHEVRPVLDGDGSARGVIHKYGGVLSGLQRDTGRR